MLLFKRMAFMALLASMCAPLGQVWAAEKTTYLLNTSTGAPYATEDKSGFLDLVVAEAFRRIGEKGEVPIYTASKRALINANEGVDHASPCG